MITKPGLVIFQESCITLSNFSKTLLGRESHNNDHHCSHTNHNNSVEDKSLLAIALVSLAASIKEVFVSFDLCLKIHFLNKKINNSFSLSE
jgi:hypothetical protein